MKGLLLKDFYMLRKYCKVYLLLALVFVFASLSGTQNLFFIFYPCMVCSMLPANLLAYDEKSRWLQYSETLPYSKKQLVSVKYLIGLILQGSMLILTAIVQAIVMHLDHVFDLKNYLVLMMLLLTMSLISSSITLPFMFKWGVERGRISYYLMIALVCFGSVAIANATEKGLLAKINPNGVLIAVCLVSIALYALSWCLSIVFYKKREV